MNPLAELPDWYRGPLSRQFPPARLASYIMRSGSEHREGEYMRGLDLDVYCRWCWTLVRPIINSRCLACGATVEAIVG